MKRMWSAVYANSEIHLSWNSRCGSLVTAMKKAANLGLSAAIYTTNVSSIRVIVGINVRKGHVCSQTEKFGMSRSWNEKACNPKMLKRSLACLCYCATFQLWKNSFSPSHHWATFVFSAGTCMLSQIYHYDFIRHFRFVFVLHSYIHFYLLQVANVLLVSEMISVLLCVCVYILVSFSVRKKSAWMCNWCYVFLDILYRFLHVPAVFNPTDFVCLWLQLVHSKYKWYVINISSIVLSE